MTVLRSLVVRLVSIIYESIKEKMKEEPCLESYNGYLP